MTRVYLKSSPDEFIRIQATVADIERAFGRAKVNEDSYITLVSAKDTNGRAAVLFLPLDNISRIEVRP